MAAGWGPEKLFFHKGLQPTGASASTSRAVLSQLDLMVVVLTIPVELHR